MNANVAPILDHAYALERVLQSHDPRLTGSIYTPPWLARTLVQKALGPRFERRTVKQLRKLRILDPACGSGIIILAAVELLATRLSALGALAELPEIAPTIFYGVDRNPLAITTTRALLSQSIGLPESLVHPALDTTFRVGDTLIESPEALLSAKHGFDVVIGNPPYGLARGDQLTAGENAILKRIFATTRNGRINKYLAFMARGFELLRPSGTLAFIVPNSWLGIKEAQGVRELLVSHGELHELTILPPDTFPGRGVETVLFVAHRGIEAARIELRHTTLGPPLPRRALSLEKYRHRPGIPLTVNIDPRIEAVWEKLNFFPTLLTGNYGLTPRIALQAYATGKGVPPQTPEIVQRHSFHTREPVSPTSLTYLHGKDIKRYRIAWSGWYLSHGPWLAEPQRLEFFTGPRLIIREILGKPPYTVTGAFIEEPALYNKSVLHILGNDRDLLLALLGILNSKLATFIFMTRGRKGARNLFPKLLAADLKDLPLPFERQTLSPLIHRVAQHRGNDSTLDIALDRAVYELYSLAPREIETIERVTARRL